MDELNEYLKNCYPNNYISGYQDCNLLLWGKDGTIPKMFSLIIGIEYEPYVGMREGKSISDVLNSKYRTDISFNRLMKYGERIAKLSNIPFITLVYPSLRDEFNEIWNESEMQYDRRKVLFYWYDFSKKENKKINCEVFDGITLKKKIYDILEVNFTDEGTTKSENSHLSDYFHYWSRQTLSRNITKLDIDGILINNNGDKGIFIEIKRSSKPHIPNWKPKYDKANYSLESNYANRISAYFWLLHHESRPCDEEEIISFYRIDGVNENENTDFIISGDTVLKMNVSGNNSLKSRIEQFIIG